MPDTKDDGSGGEMQGMTPLRGGGYPPRKKPFPADFKEWARRDLWHIAEGVMLLLGFKPFNVNAHSWPKGIEGFDDIYDTASRSIAAGTLRATPRHYVIPRNFLAWAHEKGYRVPRKLEELVNRHPKAEGTPQAGAENSDLTPLKPQNETPGQRRARITARHQDLKAGGNRHPTKTVAEEECISEGRVRQLMKPMRPLSKAR